MFHFPILVLAMNDDLDYKTAKS